MFQKNNNFALAVDLGTSTFRVLVGAPDSADNLEIIGVGEAPSLGSVVKGEIVNVELAQTQLALALEQVENACNIQVSEIRRPMVLVTGSGIDYFDGIGTVIIKNADHKVRYEDQEEAVDNARYKQLPAGQDTINYSEYYFILDNNLRVRNPVGHSADKLDAFVHVVYGIKNRLDNFSSLLYNAGIDYQCQATFSPLAAGVGILSQEERENGILLVDFGAGTTEFLVEHNMGTAASGVLQVGFNHVINDLALAFNLPSSYWRKVIENNLLNQAFHDDAQFFEIHSGPGKAWNLPITSIEQVIDCRIRETFEIIAEQLQKRVGAINLGAGGVLTGGGAKFSRSGKIFREVFDCPLRIGQPINISGVVTGLEDPRYSAVWGALKHADACNWNDEQQGGAANSVKRFLRSVFKK